MKLTYFLILFPTMIAIAIGAIDSKIQNESRKYSCPLEGVNVQATEDIIEVHLASWHECGA